MSVKRRWSLLAAVVLLATMLVAMVPGPAAADGHVETLFSFSFADAEAPEGVTVDKAGNVFYPYSPLGLVWKLPKNGEPYVFGHIDGIDITVGDFGILGMTVDRSGNVYAGVGSTNPDANGVWKLDRNTGHASRLPGTEAIAMPNDMAFDLQGNLYITDTPAGAVWRIPRGGELEVWIQSPLLEGVGILIPGFPLGANGIEVHKRTAYVAVTEQASIVEIPISDDGSAGTASVWHAAPELFAIDGLAIARSGNIYAAVIGQSTLVRVNADHSLDVIATQADGLDWNSSLAFGTNEEDTSIYMVNYGIGPLQGFPEVHGPGLLRVEVGEKGTKVPG